jgi:AraC-like DNA-binding protein
MSPSRQSRQHRPLTVEQEPFLSARSLAVECNSGYVIEPHRHGWHQLVYACAGAMTVQAGRSSWMIPPAKTVFIPAGFSHSVRMWGRVSVRFLYFPASVQAPALESPECRVLSVTPLLRELILRVTELGALDAREPAHQSLLTVLLDEMNIAPETPWRLPLPADARAIAVARHVLDTPTCPETLDDLARCYGVGRRTLERLFRCDTGLSFGLWRQKVRLLDSIRLLAEGKSVTDAALDSGYASVSAFVAAFKQTFGCTPGRF